MENEEFFSAERLLSPYGETTIRMWKLEKEKEEDFVKTYKSILYNINCRSFSWKRKSFLHPTHHPTAWSCSLASIAKVHCQGINFIIVMQDKCLCETLCQWLEELETESKALASNALLPFMLFFILLAGLMEMQSPCVWVAAYVTKIRELGKNLQGNCFLYSFILSMDIHVVRAVSQQVTKTIIYLMIFFTPECFKNWIKVKLKLSFSGGIKRGTSGHLNSIIEAPSKKHWSTCVFD